MKYPETPERSKEHLRTALALMSKHQAALNPITYAVWYEYAAGRNGDLTREIDLLTKGDAKLDERTTRRLHHTYIAELDDQTVARLNAQFQRVLTEVTDSATRTGGDATLFGERLQEWERELEEKSSVPALHDRVTGVLEDTRVMQASIARLQTRLEASQNEIAQLRKELSRVKEEALVDALTGLLNRRAFDEKIQQVIAAKTEQSLGPCLMLVDIDNFKRINDTFGHVFGDQVIRSIGEALKAAVKGQDTVARYGGEEFALLLPETPIAGAEVVAERLRDSISRSRIRRHASEEQVGSITVSVGLASHNMNETVTAFIERVDAALYVSKARGRNRVTVV